MSALSFGLADARGQVIETCGSMGYDTQSFATERWSLATPSSVVIADKWRC